MTRIEIRMVLNGYIVSNDASGKWEEEYAKDWNSVIECLNNVRKKYEDKLI